MRQSSIIIHKGKKEEKYEIYVEDYVISFLKEKAEMARASEILFYGCREKECKRYTIYGAGQDRHIAVFDKYELLEEISCRLTQGEPVFCVKETAGTYEVKGYHVFYYENEEMQDYLIHRNVERNRKSAVLAGQGPVGRGEPWRGKVRSDGQPVKEKGGYAVTLQLGVVFVVLVAIVINSSNSYDKMKQLNQSAEEVFFVIENQEAEEYAGTERENGGNDVVVERDAPQDDALQSSVLRENALHEQENGSAESEGENSNDPEAEEADAAGKSPDDKTTDMVGNNQEPQLKEIEQPKEAEEESALTDTSQEEAEEEDGGGVEALSRNVARYYEVERGDTLYKISQKVYGDTSHVKKICELNQISDPDSIRYGQKIILP